MIWQSNRELALLFVAMVFSFTVSGQVYNPKGVVQEWQTDTSKHSVPLSEFVVLLKRDMIVPIDKPLFLKFHQADEEFLDNEPVIAVRVNGESKGYPLSILMYHEIVNDVLGGRPIAVTFCPLCHSAIVFDREVTIDGQPETLTFGTSGMLRNSDLVMWDRQTESWWQQFTGEAVVGSLTGVRLNVISSDLVSYYDFKHLYPGSLVMTYPFGYISKYGNNPYVGYDSEANEHPSLFTGIVDPRLPPTSRVVGVIFDSVKVAWPLDTIAAKGVFYDKINGIDIVMFFEPGMLSVLDKKAIAASKQTGSVMVFDRNLNGKLMEFTYWKDDKFRDSETNSVWRFDGVCVRGALKGAKLRRIPSSIHFAFAWFAFYPESKLQGQK